MLYHHILLKAQFMNVFETLYDHSVARGDCLQGKCHSGNDTKKSRFALKIKLLQKLLIAHTL